MIASGTTIDVAAREDWLAERRKGIGASDAASVLGVCPFRTPIDTWQDKLGIAPPRDESEPMLWGNLLEGVIVSEYERRTGREVFDRQKFVVHPSVPWMRATLDGATSDRLLEVKTASAWAREWGDEGGDNVPDAYLVQVHHQMACTGHERADVAVLIGGQRLKIYEVERDDNLVAALMERESEFWDCVQTRTPPSWGRLDAKALAVLHPDCEGYAEWSAEDAALVALMVAGIESENETINAAQKRADEGKRIVLEAMGDAQFGRLPDGRLVKRFLQRVEATTRTVNYAASTRHYFRILKGESL